MTLASGTRLGRYEIRHKIGSGGMGEVYLAWDPELEREIAIKVLRADHDESPERTRRFVQEAKAASALSHPNVAHVYEIGTEGDLRYIAMEVVQGETLRQRIARGEIPVDDVISIGSQVAAALAAAHGSGIVHRDMKPENVIVRPDGYVKVLDFGLAKLVRRDAEAETLLKTRPGAVMGTPRYMAPEQFGGSDVTPPADVFSLGVVLYETLTGRRPFDGDDSTALVRAILSEDPVPPTKLRDAIPPRLCEILTKALQKDPELRYPSAAELLEDLKQVSRETTAAAFESSRSVLAAPRRRRWTAIAITLLVLIVAAVVIVAAQRAQRLREARDTVDEAQRLLDAHRFVDAWELASSAAERLPDDPRVQAILSATTTAVTFESEPAGADVYLDRYLGDGTRVRAGTTPLTITLPIADHVATFEKPGFAPALRSLPLAPLLTMELVIPPPPTTLRARLVESEKAPKDMVLVEGETYRLAGWSRPSDRAVELEDFFIDRFEVSNRDFEEFVREGGYRRPELWQHSFQLDGRILAFDEAMTRLRDTTGLPGPRFWIGGAPPPGREDHPVTGVSWYEAAAFAAWKGKALPTVFQWERAARYPMHVALGAALPWGIVVQGVDVTDRANFLGKGTMPVDSMPFGLSDWGALHMAGNVAEWCANPFPPGFAARGGSWNDPIYQFGQTGSLPGFFASEHVGFRCVLMSGTATDQGSFALDAVTMVPEYHPIDDATFEEIRRRYDYTPTPMESRVIETAETSGWTREKIEYEVSGKTVPAYLYLPKGFEPPFQVIHFSPAGDVVQGHRELTASIEVILPAQIRGGRAVFSVVSEGFLGRPRTIRSVPDSRAPEYVDFVVEQVTELRRGLDVLETRGDIDAKRIAFVAPSAGAGAGVILVAVEPRYRSVTFIGTQLRPREVGNVAAANRINFVPRITAPTMMVQGRYDETAPLTTHAEPFFNLLRAPKRLEVYEGTHMPGMEILVPILSGWLDETLGPVGSPQ